MRIHHPQDPETTLESIQADVNAIKQNHTQHEFVFTYVTVQVLLDTIKELEHELLVAINEVETLENTYARVNNC